MVVTHPLVFKNDKNIFYLSNIITHPKVLEFSLVLIRCYLYDMYKD